MVHIIVHNRFHQIHAPIFSFSGHQVAPKSISLLDFVKMTYELSRPPKTRFLTAESTKFFLHRNLRALNYLLRRSQLYSIMKKYIAELGDKLL